MSQPSPRSHSQLGGLLSRYGGALRLDAVRVDCPTCGPQRATSWIREGPWSVVRCSQCALGITWPRPTPDVLTRIYSSRDYYVTRRMDDGVGADAEDRAREILQGRRNRTRRVLDFGAGEGHLVAALGALGVHAVGIESSEAGRGEARRRYGIEMWAEVPADGQARDQDLIVLCHSLEHVRDPLGLLVTLRGCLAPGGEVFIEVPNADSFEMLRPKRRRLILDLPVHLFHFTPDTLTTLLAAAGFTVTQLRLTNPAWLEWLFARRTALRSRTRRPPATSENRALDREVVAGWRSHWRHGLLPWLRRTCPGWKFQVVAVPRSPIGARLGVRDCR